MSTGGMRQPVAQATSEPRDPILGSAAAVRDSPDCDQGLLARIYDGERKSPQQKVPGALISFRPTIWVFRDYAGSTIELVDEVQGGFRASLPIPSHRAPDISSRSLVILNAASAHSPSPEADDAVLSRERLQPVPLPSLSYGARLPGPTLLERTHLGLPGYRAANWLMPHARQLVG